MITLVIISLIDGDVDNDEFMYDGQCGMCTVDRSEQMPSKYSRRSCHFDILTFHLRIQTILIEKMASYL